MKQSTKDSSRFVDKNMSENSSKIKKPATVNRLNQKKSLFILNPAWILSLLLIIVTATAIIIIIILNGGKTEKAARNFIKPDSSLKILPGTDSLVSQETTTIANDPMQAKEEIVQKEERIMETSDPRAQIARKSVQGIIGGQIDSKQVASPDIFGKSGFASDIDAILKGVGGLKSGSGGGICRKG